MPGAASWLATDGLLQTAPGLAFKTDKITILSNGTINLNNEALDMDFQSNPSKTLNISASEFINPYIKVVGTLAKPAITLNPTRALISGTAAVTTGGLSILAKAAFDRIKGTQNPCEAVLKAAAEIRRESGR